APVFGGFAFYEGCVTALSVVHFILACVLSGRYHRDCSPSFDSFARILVFHHPRPGIFVNRSCADTDESDTAGVIGCVDLRMAVVAVDREARRYLPFSNALCIEAARLRCTCFCCVTLTGRPF